MKWCKLGENTESATALFTAIGENDSLESLDLSSNGIMSSMGKSLALCGLKSNFSLKIIDLSWNKIGDSAVATMIDILKSNKSIQKLNLSGNDISNLLLSAIGKSVLTYDGRILIRFHFFRQPIDS